MNRKHNDADMEYMPFYYANTFMHIQLVSLENQNLRATIHGAISCSYNMLNFRFDGMIIEWLFVFFFSFSSFYLKFRYVCHFFFSNMLLWLVFRGLPRLW